MQTASVAVMATGMVLVIVSRNIDLSVGSLVGFTGMVMGYIQEEPYLLPAYLGLDHPATWVIALAIGVALGALIGALQGYIIAYPQRARLHRDAGRASRLARRRLVGGAGADDRAARHQFPAPRRRRLRVGRRDLELDHRRSSPASAS